MTRLVQVSCSFWLHAWSWNVNSPYTAIHLLQCQIFLLHRNNDEYREDEPGLDVHEGQRYLLNNSTITKLIISKPKVNGKSKRSGERMGRGLPTCIPNPTELIKTVTMHYVPLKTWGKTCNWRQMWTNLQTNSLVFVLVNFVTLLVTVSTV